MSHREGDNLEKCSIAVLLRLAADGELTAAQRVRLEAHLRQHPEDAARLAFDQKLREACKRACCPGECAPPALRRRIVACCCKGQDCESSSGPGAAGRERGYWLGRVATRFGALAALIGLIAVVGFLVVRSGGGGPAGQPNQLAASLAGFVRTEHARCVDGGPELGEKFTIHEAGLVPTEFSTIAGRPVTLPCLVKAEKAGLHFVDAGVCHPPGGDALHIRFRVGDGEGSRGLVSLWVQRDDGRLRMEDGVTYTQGEGCECVRFWRLDGVRYMLVSSDGEATPTAAVALDSPPTIQPF